MGSSVCKNDERGRLRGTRDRGTQEGRGMGIHRTSGLQNKCAGPTTGNARREHGFHDRSQAVVHGGGRSGLGCPSIVQVSSISPEKRGRSVGSLTEQGLLMATPNSLSPESFSNKNVQMWISPPFETSFRFSTNK